MCDAFRFYRQLADKAMQPYRSVPSPYVVSRSLEIFQELNESKLRIYKVYPWKGMSFLRCDNKSRLIGRFRPGEGGWQGKTSWHAHKHDDRSRSKREEVVCTHRQTNDTGGIPVQRLSHDAQAARVANVFHVFKQKHRGNGSARLYLLFLQQDPRVYEYIVVIRCAKTVQHSHRLVST